MYPICAPAAVRLDAETGLSPIPDIGQQPYEHVANPEPSPDADVGSGPMARGRTTSLSNPLFEQVGAVPSHMSSHDVMSGAQEHEEDTSAGASGLQEASVAEATSPLTGVFCNHQCDHHWFVGLCTGWVCRHHSRSHHRVAQ